VLLLTAGIVGSLGAIASADARSHAGVGVYVLRSGSMSPGMPTGTAIITRPATTYVPGDAITYREGTRTVTHRVVEVTADGRFVTKGDANASHDSWLVDPADVRGKVAVQAPWVGYALIVLRHPLALLVEATAVVVTALRRRPRSAPRGR
jgi:signal peptidase I